MCSHYSAHIHKVLYRSRKKMRTCIPNISVLTKYFYCRLSISIYIHIHYIHTHTHTHTHQYYSRCRESELQTENFNFPTFILCISLPKSNVGKYNLIPFELFHIRSNFIMNIQRHNQFSCLHLTQFKIMFSTLKRYT